MCGAARGPHRSGLSQENELSTVPSGSALYGALIAAHDPVTMKLDAAKFAGLINPGFSGYVDDVGVGVNAYNVNCGLCAQAVAYAFDGRPHTAAGVEHPVSLAEMVNWAGTSQSPQSSEEIEDRLRSMPPGSHAIVGVDWEDGDGHWFNAYWDGQTVWKVDGQDGSCEPWPPDFPPVTDRCRPQCGRPRCPRAQRRQAHYP